MKRLMWFPDIKFYLKDKIKAYLPKRYPEFKPQSSARRKIVVQNYIDHLNGDYKVLVFANKFYVLSREIVRVTSGPPAVGYLNFPLM